MVNTMSELQSKNVDVLLAEYQASNSSRDHYDSVRWTIGSIFFGASLATYGVSFLAYKPLEIVAIAMFSQAFFAVFVLYDQLVQPYIEISLKRCRAIEKQLEEKLGEGPKLHRLTHGRTHERKLTGKRLFRSLIVITTFAWIFRLAVYYFSRRIISVAESQLLITGMVVLGVLGVCLWGYAISYPHGLDLEIPGGGSMT